MLPIPCIRVCCSGGDHPDEDGCPPPWSNKMARLQLARCSHDPLTGNACTYLESSGFGEPQLNTYWYPSSQGSAAGFSQWISSDFRYELMQEGEGAPGGVGSATYRIRLRSQDVSQGVTTVAEAAQPRILCPSQVDRWREGGRVSRLASFSCLAARPAEVSGSRLNAIRKSWNDGALVPQGRAIVFKPTSCVPQQTPDSNPHPSPCLS